MASTSSVRCTTSSFSSETLSAADAAETRASADFSTAFVLEGGVSSCATAVAKEKDCICEIAGIVTSAEACGVTSGLLESIAARTMEPSDAAAALVPA